jgi:hypothetical protein
LAALDWPFCFVRDQAARAWVLRTEANAGRRGLFPGFASPWIDIVDLRDIATMRAVEGYCKTK